MNKVVNRTSKYPRRVSKQGDTFGFGLVVKWTIWGSTKQWFHKLLVFYACLSVWLHKNDLYCLLKILIPGLLFQSFLSGNMCFTRLSRWLYAKLCLGNTDVKCHESLGMFGFIKWVKLIDDVKFIHETGIMFLNSFPYSWIPETYKWIQDYCVLAAKIYVASWWWPEDALTCLIENVIFLSWVKLITFPPVFSWFFYCLSCLRISFSSQNATRTACLMNIPHPQSRYAVS